MAQTQRDSTSFGKTSIVRAEITNRGRLGSDIVRGLRAELEAAAPPVASRGTPAGRNACLRVSAKPLQV